MGYTNYWKLDSDRVAFSESVLEKVKKIYSAYAGKHGYSLVAGCNCDWDAIATEALIMFNDPGEDAFETFVADLSNPVSGFCKTGRRPYDAAVKAVLIVLKSEGYVSDWTFDGGVTDVEYANAIELIRLAGIEV